MELDLNFAMVRFYPLLFWILLIPGIISCGRKDDHLSDKADLSALAGISSRVKQNPKEAIRRLDSIFRSKDIDLQSDSVLIKFMQTRAAAWLALGCKDSAYQFMQGMFNRLSAEDKTKARISCGFWLTQMKREDGRYFQAQKYMEETMSLFDTTVVNAQLAEAYNLQGTIQQFRGDFAGARKNFQHALQLFDSLGLIRPTGPVLCNIANTYQSMNETDQTLRYYRKALQISEQTNDSTNYFSTLSNIGVFYLRQKSDSAEIFFLQALKFFPESSWSVRSLRAKFNLANLYFDQKKYDQALAMYNDVLTNSRKYSINSGIYRAMSGIGNIYEAQNKDREALNIFRDAADLAASSGETPVQVGLLEAVEYMYEKAGDYKGAYSTQKRIRNLNDSLMTLDKQLAVHDIEMIYNNEKAKRENLALAAENKVLANRMRANLIILLIMVIAALILGGLLYYIYNLYRQRDEAYNTLFGKYRIDIQSGIPTPEIVPEKILLPELVPEKPDAEYRLLVNYFEQEKPYLMKDLKISDVANQLNISEKTLSRLIRNHTGKYFNNFVNDYRIREVLRLLSEPVMKNYKIEAIAKEAGFGSKATFYAAFTHVTGSYPSAYR